MQETRRCKCKVIKVIFVSGGKDEEELRQTANPRPLVRATVSALYYTSFLSRCKCAQEEDEHEERVQEKKKRKKLR